MDPEKQIEEMANELCFEYNHEKLCENCYRKHNKQCIFIPQAEKLYNAGYRKIPENAVVLTANEKVDRWIDLLTEFDEMGFEPTTLPPKEMSAEEYAKFWKAKLVGFLVNARKETAEKFADRLVDFFVEKDSNNDLLASFTIAEWHGMIRTIFDEICKELTGDIEQ